MLAIAASGGLSSGAIARPGHSPSEPGTAFPAHSPLLLSQATTSALRSGDSGEAVTQLQERLAVLGYYQGPVTGFFGEQTEAAVIAFQTSVGLAADGVVGPGTQSALAQASTTPAPSAPGPIRAGATGDQVIALQERLRDLGYYEGAIDGDFGDATTAAVIAFQGQNGLAADGVVGPATEAALRQSDAVPASASTARPPASERPGTSTTTSSAGVLKRGSSGREVIVLQSQLQALGYYQGAINGEFDQATETAVARFQESQGLVADGLVGPQTVYLLDEQFFALRSGDSASPQAPTQGPAAQTAPTPNSGAPTAVAPAPTPVFPNTPSNPNQPNPNQPAPSVSVPTAPTLPNSVPNAAPSPTVVAPPAPLPTPGPMPAPAATMPPTNLSPSSAGVMEIQRQLQQRGVYSGPIDGVMTPEIEQAIMSNQQERGLSPADIAR
jgi:peptidoglycan hydrolase-like protein with peptidoglycan-binding domain